MEKHVFDDINFFPDKMKILILGTFPVPLYSNKEKFEKLNDNEKSNAWYYSSKRSEFWKIIAGSFNIEDNDFLYNKKKKKELFYTKKIGIADVFSKCIRKKENSARDTDLIVLEYNDALCDVLLNKNIYKELDIIIFTSRFTENNFFKILKDNDINYILYDSADAYNYYNKGINDKLITIDIIDALRERYISLEGIQKRIKLVTITLKISPIKGVSLYSTKLELYKYYLNSI